MNCFFTIWDIHTKKEIFSAEFDPCDVEVIGDFVSRPGVHDLAFVPGSTLLIAGAWGGKVHVWDYLKGNEIYSFQSPRDYGIRDISVSPDGSRAAILGGGALSVWNIKKRLYELQIFEESAMFMADFSPDSKTIAYGSDDSIVLYDIANKREIQRCKNLEGYVLRLLYAPDGRNIFSIIDITSFEKKVSRGWQSYFGIFDTKTCKSLRYDPQAFKGTITDKDRMFFFDISLSPDGRVATICCADNIILWKIPETSR